MKKLFSFFLLSILSFSASATHNMAADISYQHVSARTYKIIVTTYTNADPATTSADRCQLTVYFGDGDSAVAPRVNGSSFGLCSGSIPDGEPLTNCFGRSMKKNLIVPGNI